MLNNIVMISVCVQILLNPEHPLPMMTHLVLSGFYCEKLLMLYLSSLKQVLVISLVSFKAR